VSKVLDEKSTCMFCPVNTLEKNEKLRKVDAINRQHYDVIVSLCWCVLVTRNRRRGRRSPSSFTTPM